MIRHPGRRMRGVERVGELGIPVADQRLEAASAILEVHEQVAGLLGRPLSRQVSRARFRARGLVPPPLAC